MVDRRLGRGLDFFLSRTGSDSPDAEGEAKQDGLRMVPIQQLAPNPHQPRTEMSSEALEELAQSVRQSGLLQPILARQGDQGLEIIAGERRWRAAKRAGLEMVPVLVREVSPEESAVLALVENVQRQDLNAIEKAEAFKALQQALSCTQDELARKVGLERSSVANLIRLLELAPDVRALVSRGTLSMGHARALLGVADQGEQFNIAALTVRERWSVRDLEAHVRGRKAPEQGEAEGASSAPKGGGRSRPAWLQESEDNLKDALSTPVRVTYGRKRAKITIECAGRDEFERLYNRLLREEG